MRTTYIFVLLLLGTAIFIVHTPRNIVVPQIESLGTFPSHLGKWVAVQDTIFDQPILNVLRPTDYLMRTYANAGGNQLSLYIGYHNGGPASGPIHSPRNCLPSAGWMLESSKNMQILAAGDTINLVQADFKKDNTKVRYYYWYQMRNKSISQDMALKLAEFTGMLLYQRKDASFIRIGIERSDPAHDEKILQDFLAHAYPALRRFLPA